MEHRSALNWFEIPVTDMDRAQAFYEKLLGTALRREAIGDKQLGVFEYDEAGTGGCLIAGATAPRPADRGTMVYLHAGAALDGVLDRLVPAGGLLALEKVQLPGDMGSFVHIIDTEGNRVGLHAAR